MRPRLVTLDALGTLYSLRGGGGRTYRDVAVQIGAVARDTLSDAECDERFASALQSVARRYPNYGRGSLKSAEEWWGKVVGAVVGLPELLAGVQQVVRHFQTSAPFKLHLEVDAFMRQRAGVLVGLASNSDPGAGQVIAGFPQSSCLKQYFDANPRLRFFSYDLQVSKPDRRFFDKVRRRAALVLGHGLVEEECVHVGDEVTKDWDGAAEAGWNAVLVDRGNVHGYLRPGQALRAVDSRRVVVSSLEHLGSAISMY